MVNRETVRESVVIKVDFVRAGETRKSEPVVGGAKVIDLGEARLALCTIELRSSFPAPRRPSRPFGGAPGGYGGPF